MNWLLNWIWSTRHYGLEFTRPSGLLMSMLQKLSWFLLTGLKTLRLLMWKWVGLFLKKNHLLRCCGWLSLLNWIGALTLPVLLKLSPRNLAPWYVIWSFFLLGILCIPINLSYDHAWNTIVMSGLVALLAANC